MNLKEIEREIKKNKKRNTFNLFLICLNVLILLMLCGALMNTLAIARNGGKMPVYFLHSNFSNEDHFSFSNFSEIKEAILVDRIYFNGNILSYGDVLIYSGTFFISLLLIITLFIIPIKNLIITRKNKSSWKDL